MTPGVGAKADLSASAERTSALAELLRWLDAGALVLLSATGDDPDRALFTGRANLGTALVVAKPGATPRLGYFTPMERDEAAATGLDLLTPDDLDLARWHRDSPQAGAFHANAVGQALLRCGVGPGRIALAGRLPFGLAQEIVERLGGEGWTFVSATEPLLTLRRRKSAAELAEVRRVSAAVVAAFRHVAGRLAATEVRAGELWLMGERLRVARLKSEIAELFARSGLDQPRANIVAPAEEGGVPHSAGTLDRVLRAAESLVVDLFPRAVLFSDCTRTFCVGDPPPALTAAHAATLAALELAHAGARPGARGWDLQQRICAHFSELGYATPISAPGTLNGYVHGLGHGVGYELHEYPTFKHAAGAEGILAVGDLVTLEPGLYDPDPEGGFGVRLEDLVALHSDGNENLTAMPYSLDPRAWH
ncbi:MAG: M24 family metallopeptidase [Thermoanaerobaculia bacterium]